MLWGLLVIRPPEGGFELNEPAHKAAPEPAYEAKSPDTNDDVEGLLGVIRAYGLGNYGPLASASFAPPGV